MGCFIPDVYKYRLLKRPRKWIAEHVNGGACYSRDFSKVIPREARNDVFDVAVFPYVAKEPGRMKVTQTIALTTMDRCRFDIVDERRMILHGFMQEKDDFIDRCRQPVSFEERKQYENRTHYRPINQMVERTKLLFTGRGPEAMLNAMFLEIDKRDHRQQKAA